MNATFKFPIMFILFVASGALASAEGEEKPPNILFIMSDDHAWQAISAYGSNRNVTPNIDRIADEGLVFDRYFCLLYTSPSPRDS